MRTIKIAIVLFFLLTWQAYAYVKSIHFVIAPQTIEFHIENPNGLITGYTPSGIKTAIPEIPRYYNWGIPSYEPNTDPYDYFHKIETLNLPYQLQGKYKLAIYGTSTPTVAAISLGFYWSENVDWNIKYISKRLVYPNVVWIYEFDFPTTVPTHNTIVLNKISSPNDFIQDLTTAGKLGYIGNQKFVSKLVQTVEKIEQDKIKYKKDDIAVPLEQIIKKEYTELLGEITEKYNKPEANEYVKQEAYDVLKEDMEYIIGHAL